MGEIESAGDSTALIGTVVETHRPLSASSLWRVQDAYYSGAGINAWASGEVPHLVTSGPMLARAYAAIVEGFVADCLAGRLGPVDPAEPLYLLELGSGTGRLAAHFLRALDPAALAPFRLTYVLSDRVEANLEFWRSHDRLAPHFAQGRLDLARFDALGDTTVRLERAGRTLEPGSLANPLVVVANYLFDVVPQDLFRSGPAGRLEEHVALVGADPEFGLDAGAFFRDLWLSPRPVPVPPDRYGDAELDALLEESFAARAAGPPERFLFPGPALGGIANLARLAGDRLLVVIGERPGGVPQREVEADGESALRPGALLGMGVHGGSCSLPVDLEVLGRLAGRRGGGLLLPSASPAGLLVGALVIGDRPVGADEPGARATAHRFHQAIDEGGPEDLFLALEAALEHRDELPLAMLLALVRIAGYDPYIFGKLHAAIGAKLAGATEAGLDEAVRVLEEVWVRDFPIDGATDLAFGIAGLLAPAGRYREALVFFARSRAARGPSALGAYNEALCHLHLEDVDAARACLAEACALDPGLDKARALAAQVEAELERR